MIDAALVTPMGPGFGDAAPMRAVLQRELDRQSNQALFLASMIMLCLALVLGVWLVLQLRGGAPVQVPALAVSVLAILAAIMCLAARRGRIRGGWKMAAGLVLSLAPTLVLVGAHWFAPGGVAPYLLAPIVFAYFLVVIMTGFLFDERIALAAGVVAGAGHFAAFLLAQDRLAAVITGDPVMDLMLAGAPPHLSKSLAMVTAGVLMAAVAVFHRRLIRRVIEEASERSAIDRLFGQFVSDEVKDKLMRERADMAGERKHVAVLFADIRSFTAYSETAAPEEVVAQLNAYLDAMVLAVSAEHGVVDKFIGDAIMAVFGGVVPVDNPAAAAVRASLRMRAALGVLNAQWRRARKAPFEIGVGIHYGEVVQGPVGSEHRKQFTVIGDTVNTASRLERMSKKYPQAILVSGAIHDRLDASLRSLCVAHGAAFAEGRTEAIPLYGVGDAGGE